MNIQHSHHGTRGKFFVNENGQQDTAVMTYIDVDNSTILIDHTEVDDVHKGKGIGAQLVKAAVDMAREKGLKIIPECPFARSVFERKTEYADVLAR